MSEEEKQQKKTPATKKKRPPVYYNPFSRKPKPPELLFSGGKPFIPVGQAGVRPLSYVPPPLQTPVVDNLPPQPSYTSFSALLAATEYKVAQEEKNKRAWTVRNKTVLGPCKRKECGKGSYYEIGYCDKHIKSPCACSYGDCEKVIANPDVWPFCSDHSGTVKKCPVCSKLGDWGTIGFCDPCWQKEKEMPPQKSSTQAAVLGTPSSSTYCDYRISPYTLYDVYFAIDCLCRHERLKQKEERVIDFFFKCTPDDLLAHIKQMIKEKIEHDSKYKIVYDENFFLPEKTKVGWMIRFRDDPQHERFTESLMFQRRVNKKNMMVMISTRFSPFNTIPYYMRKPVEEYWNEGKCTTCGTQLSNKGECLNCSVFMEKSNKTICAIRWCNRQKRSGNVCREHLERRTNCANCDAKLNSHRESYFKFCSTCRCIEPNCENKIFDLYKVAKLCRKHYDEKQAKSKKTIVVSH